MKSLLATATLVTTACVAFGKDEPVAQRLKSTDNIVWAGLDYSLMRMMGSTNSMRVPNLLFQNMPARWNELFLDERIEGVAGLLKKRVLLDLAAVTERNKSLNSDQLVMDSRSATAIKLSHLSSNDIAKVVGSYKMNQKRGLGLVFVVDRMVYLESTFEELGVRRENKTPRASLGEGGVGFISHAAAVYVVFFDVASREVISVRREIRDVTTGGSFRNFWFGPIKDIDSDLGKYR
jgi:hypothetical protein